MCLKFFIIPWRKKLKKEKMYNDDGIGSGDNKKCDWWERTVV